MPQLPPPPPLGIAVWTLLLIGLLPAAIILLAIFVLFGIDTSDRVDCMWRGIVTAGTIMILVFIFAAFLAASRKQTLEAMLGSFWLAVTPFVVGSLLIVIGVWIGVVTGRIRLLRKRARTRERVGE